MNLVIRHETTEEYDTVDALIRRAFWNLFMPGCNEHYLAHVLRKSVDYLAEFSLIALLDGEIVGQIMYSRSFIVNQGETVPVLTFGPLAVDPEKQNQGIGAKLIEASVHLAKAAKETAIVIFGHPTYYHRFGFEPCEKYHIVTDSGYKTDAFMTLNLHENALPPSGTFYASKVFDEVDDAKAVEDYDQAFPPLNKGEAKFHIDSIESMKQE